MSPRCPLVVATLAAFAAAPVSATAADRPLTHAVKQLIKGKATAAGCRVEMPRMSPAAPYNAVEVRELSRDEARCESVVEVGVPVLTPDERAPREVPADAVQAVPPPDTKSDQPAEASIAALPPGGGGSWNHRQGYVKGWVEDPYDIDLTWVESWIDLYWDGYRYVTGISCWNAGVGRDGYTGWRGPYNLNTSCTYSAGSYSADSATYVEFYNPVFCTATTYVKHNRTLARGQYWGALQGDSGITWSGGCTYLLTRNYRVVYTI